MGSPWQEECLAARVQENESLADVLVPAMALRPDKVAIFFEGTEITYRQMDEAGNRVANALIELGIKPGERVAMHIDNRPEFIYGFHGIMRAGAVLVPTNVMYTAPEMAHIIGDSGARAVIVLNEFEDKMHALDVDSLEFVIALDDPKNPESNCLSDMMLMAGDTPPTIKRNPDEVAIIQYTSGTTGQPKGAMVSDNNILAVLRNTTDLPGSIDAIEEDAMLLTLPLFHAYALDLAINRSFLSVQTMVLFSRFDAVGIFKAFEEHKITIFYGAPPMYFAFVNTPECKDYDSSSLRGAYSGAAPLPVVTMEQFKELTGVQINEGYGLSETAPTLSTNMAGPVNKPGSVGPPIREVEIKLVDSDGKEVDQGEVGEIKAKGPNIFLGYWNLPEETANAVQDGWFFTGDMGRFDEDGYLYIVDRKKDMIVVSGFNVYPIELENVILRHPKIIDCAVIGVPSDYQGESVKAVCVLAPGESLDYDELETYCREQMAAFKVPKFLSIRDELPKNATGKVLKRVIREEEGGITKATT
ncbi:MAG: long-chain fatty acid--CoA ligase [Candidatus Hydrogenedentota bacterium]